VIISEGLRKFIDKSVLKQDHDSVIRYISAATNHVKFARILKHEFLSMLDKSNFRECIDINFSNELGFLYCSNGISSERETRIAELYGTAPWEGGWLIVNLTGCFAIYRPEGEIDNEVFIELKQSTLNGL